MVSPALEVLVAMLPTLRLSKPVKKLAQLMPSELAIREAAKYGHVDEGH